MSVVVVGSLLTAGFASGAEAEVVSEASPSAATTSAADAARTQAQSAGEAVEVLAETTETSRRLANADGSWTQEVSASPVRVRQDGEWTAVDTVLVRRADGTIGPRAAALAMSFSDGGVDPLVRITEAGASLAWTWSRPLPEPVLKGDTATYADVLPDVDLVLRAGVESFSEVFVVHTVEAAAHPALAELTFESVVTGGELVARPDGGLDVVANSGEAVLAAPAPLMWDSSGAVVGEPTPVAAERGLTPIEGDEVEVIPAAVEGGTVTLTPPMEMAAQPGVEFPLYVDPVISATRKAWAMVNRSFPTTSYVNWGDADQGVGFINTSGTHLKRLFWNYNTEFLRGKQVLSARFSAFQTHAYSCTPSQVNLWTTWGFDTGVTWNNQPPLMRHAASATTANGRGGCNDGGAWVEFDATSIAHEIVANNWGQVGLGLLAANEESNSGWKRFRNDAVLSVDYNSVPDVPVERQTTTPATVPCFTSPDRNSTSRPVIGVKDPILRSRLLDGDAHNLAGGFEVWFWGGSGAIWSGSTAAAAAGSWHSVRTPVLADGLYSWRVRAHDSWAASNWSGWCEFLLDTTKPAEPSVSSSQYPPSTLGEELGTPGAFNLAAAGSADVVQYKYAFNSDVPNSTVTPASPGAGAAITFTPTQFGTNFMSVQSFDRAGNPSPIRSYVFRVAGGTPAAEWFFDEGDGTTSASADTRSPALLSAAGATWAGARERMNEFGSPVVEPGHSLRFDGAAGFASVPQDLLRTDRSFSVSAWVNLDPATAASATAASGNGTNTSAFDLGYDAATGRFHFRLAATDATSPQWVTVTSATAAPKGTWVHLAGVYDHQARRVQLYVNGAAAGTATHSGTWDATGALQIGRLGQGGIGTRYWRGGIDDVKVFNGPLDATRAVDLFEESRRA